MSDAPEDTQQALELLLAGDLPFRWYAAGSTPDALRLDVDPAQVRAAEAHFADHPVVLRDGTVVDVQVAGVAADSWLSEPDDGPRDQPDDLDPESLVGLDVQDAARRATDAGWLVRAHEPDAALTMDYRLNRLNLRYSPDGTVTRATVG